MTADAAGMTDARKNGLAERPTWLYRIEDLLERIGDRLNPILVKETRQALKSRQFVITFMAVLGFAWLWTIFSVVMAGDEVYFDAMGPDLFLGYYVILAAPMFVIVPFGAYRSLVAEQEDHTWSLLAITTLSPRQIIVGKLGSALLQMLIYLSSLAPCLTFTYLLRGLDLPTIVLVIVYTLMGSLGLSMIALLVATITWQRYWQVVLSVLMILGLFYAAGGGIAAVADILSYGFPANRSEFWIINGIIASAYVSYFALAFFAAAAQVTFTNDNRATRLRIVMLLQFLLLAGWFAGMSFAETYVHVEAFFAFFVLSGIHWGVMGGLMNGENPRLSPRVKRALPQSFLGRMFLTWFNPGPGTGYLFALCGMATALVCGSVALLYGNVIQRMSGWGRPYPNETALTGGLLIFGYLVGYLGLGHLMMRILRRWVAVPITLAFLLQVLLILFGGFVPLMIQMAVPSFRNMGYSMLQTTNVFWTLYYSTTTQSVGMIWPTVWLVEIGAAIIFVLNLPWIIREVAETRIAAPLRVQEEDTQAEAVKHPHVEKPLSPWD